MISVSAVMPTRGRREYAAHALQCYLAQTWPDRELVILDDADNPSFTAEPTGHNVRYIRVDERHDIPRKRNMVCKAASGEVIVHFDSDDWSAPTRIERQIEIFQSEKKAVCGFRLMYFWDVVKEQAWIYRGDANYVLGTSLMFKRSWWLQNQWNTKFRIGSDNVFVMNAHKVRQLTVSSVIDQMVARCHSDNTSKKRFGTKWKKTATETLPAEFFGGEKHEIGNAATFIGV
jgi:glycosyltransferase involved in cell wall biosynthesis